MLGLHHNFQCQRSIKLARIVENHISFPKSASFNFFTHKDLSFNKEIVLYHNTIKQLNLLFTGNYFLPNILDSWFCELTVKEAFLTPLSPKNVLLITGYYEDLYILFVRAILHNISLAKYMH